MNLTTYRTLTYEQFIEQPNWEDILYTNYLHDQPPLAAPNPALSTINNDVDRFRDNDHPILYLSGLPEPARDHLTRVLLLKINSPGRAYWYARYTIKGRWLEAESMISQSPSDAYWYARKVIKGRWPEAEETINQDQEYSRLYARDIISGRYQHI